MRGWGWGLAIRTRLAPRPKLLAPRRARGTLQFEVPPMQPSALRALEFHRIVEAVGGFALTPMGAERLARLQPSTDARHVAQLLAATTETTRYVAAHGVFPLRASAELPQILAALAVEGRALEAPRLLALASFLDSIDESRAAIRRAPGAFPLLEAARGGGFGSRSQARFARAPATCRGRSTRQPSSTSCRRARATRTRSTGSSRRSRPTAPSSCRRRGTPS